MKVVLALAFSALNALDGCSTVPLHVDSSTPGATPGGVRASAVVNALAAGATAVFSSSGRKPTSTLSGICRIKGEVALPCSMTVLVLTRADGTELARTRSDEYGNFEFTCVTTNVTDAVITTNGGLYETSTETRVPKNGGATELWLESKK